ncbi:MAG: hypothetical protein WC484_03200 [Candidatus Omnitrophota bacterium]
MRSGSRWSFNAGRIIAGLVCLWALSGCSPARRLSSSSEALSEGWDLFKLGDYPLAEAAFRRAAALSKPDSADRQRALYGRGMTIWLSTAGGTITRNSQRAEPFFEQAAVATADPNIAAWSSLALARLSHLMGGDVVPDYAAVREAYNRVYWRFPRHAAGQEARLYAIALRLVDFKPEDATVALAELDAFDQAHPNDLHAGNTQPFRAMCYEILDRPADLIKVKIAMMEQYQQDTLAPQTDDRARQCWEIASLAEFRLGDFALARKYYRMILAEYDVEARSYGAKCALARMERMEKELARAAKGVK